MSGKRILVDGYNVIRRHSAWNDLFHETWRRLGRPLFSTAQRLVAEIELQLRLLSNG